MFELFGFKDLTCFFYLEKELTCGAVGNFIQRQGWCEGCWQVSGEVWALVGVCGLCSHSLSSLGFSFLDSKRRSLY